MADPAASERPRRRRGPSPTQRTLQYLRKHQYLTAVVERWNSYAKIRQDLFGFADLLAVGSEIWAIQVCMIGDRGRRLTKLLESAPVTDKLRRWLQAGGTCSVIAWTKHAPGKGRTRAWWTASETRLLRQEDGQIRAWSPLVIVAGRRRRGSLRPTGRAPRGTRGTRAARTSRPDTAGPRAHAAGRDTRAARRGAPPAPWRALVGWPGGAS